MGLQCALEITVPAEVTSHPEFDHFDIQIHSGKSHMMLNEMGPKVLIPYTVNSLNLYYDINVTTVNHCHQQGPPTVVSMFRADSSRCCLTGNCSSRPENGTCKWLVIHT